jgi:LytR cell envelope-related transcriptional attenuator
VLPSVVAAASAVVLVAALVGFLSTGNDAAAGRRGSASAAAAGPGSAGIGTGWPRANRFGTGPPRAKTPAASGRAEPARGPASRPAKGSARIGDVSVDVYNDAGITGLAASVATRLQDAGWPVAGIGNWYGDVPASTVYYPASMRPQARRVARALGIGRVWPAVPPMRSDRLTVILTSGYRG